MKSAVIKATFKVYISASYDAARAMRDKICNTTGIRAAMCRAPEVQTEFPENNGIQRRAFRKFYVEVYYGWDIHGEEFAKSLEALTLLVNPLKKNYMMRPGAQPPMTRLAESMTW